MIPRWHITIGCPPTEGPYVVYGLVDEHHPEHVRYIGFTKNPETRLRRHLHNSSHKSVRKRWIQRVLKTGRRVRLITLRYASCKSEAAFCERAYIRGYRLSGHQLTNRTEGGDAGARALGKIRLKPYGVQSTESRARLSASLREWWARRKADPVQRAEITARFSAAKKGLRPNLSEEQRAARRYRSSMQVRTPEQKAKQSAYKRAWWAARKAANAN